MAHLHPRRSYPAGTRPNAQQIAAAKADLAAYNMAFKELQHQEEATLAELKKVH